MDNNNKKKQTNIKTEKEIENSQVFSSHDELSFNLSLSFFKFKTNLKPKHKPY